MLEALLVDGPSERRIVDAWDGQKSRPHLVLAAHTDEGPPYLTALAVRSRRRPPGREIPGWVELPSDTVGLPEDSVVTLAINQLSPSVVRETFDTPGLAPHLEAISNNVREVLGFPPRLRSGQKDAPRFLQYLPPHSLRRHSETAFGGLLGALLSRGWAPLRQGVIYGDHGWHPRFDAATRLFLVVSVDDFNKRFPLPLTWTVPVLASPAPDLSAWVVPLPGTATKLPGTTRWYADVRRIHSIEASQQWFSPCSDCRAERDDHQSWRAAPPSSKGPRRCVRCDGVAAEWPAEVAQVDWKELAAVRTTTARYLGVEG